MTERVCAVGIGATKVGELWDKGLRELFHESASKALKDSGMERKDIQAIYVANMSAPEFTEQNHLGPLCSTVFGSLVPALRVENSSSSGGTALHLAYQAIKSGVYDTVMVSGIEKMTDAPPPKVASIMAGAGDDDNEMFHGLSFIGLNALFARRYMHTNKVSHEDLLNFTLNAHKNGEHNELAMYRKAVTMEQCLEAPLVADPLNVMDCSPICDGGASVILTRESIAKSLGKEIISLEGTALATDTLDMQSRQEVRTLKAVTESFDRASKMAKVSLKDINLFELNDAFSSMMPLIVESMGMAQRGKGCELAKNEIGIDGKYPMSTMGGLKARGHPVGATGLYQAYEVITQLRGRAGKVQVKDASIGLAQNLGGSGSSATSNIFKRY